MVTMRRQAPGIREHQRFARAGAVGRRRTRGVAAHLAVFVMMLGLAVSAAATVATAQARQRDEAVTEAPARTPLDDRRQADPGPDEQQQAKLECGRGFYSSDGHCCPRGTIWNGKRCLRRAGLQPACPNGTFGVFPDCRTSSSAVCPPGSVGSFPNCRSVQTCPPGLAGAPPNCRKPRATRGAVVAPCPPGMAGVPPACRRINTTRPCPSGMVPAGDRCIVLPAPREVPRPNLNLQSPRPTISIPRVGRIGQ